jgi:hypothetical protein
MSSISSELLHVINRTALGAVLAIPAVPVKKNQVMNSGVIERLLDSIKPGDRCPFSA